MCPIQWHSLQKKSSEEKINCPELFLGSQSVKMIIEGRHKFGFLTREIPCPPPGDPQERYWKGEDSLIRATLMNKMEPPIGKHLLYAKTAKNIRDTAQKLCSKRQNAFWLYTLRKQVHERKQGAMDITSYFSKLSLIWQKMDLCR